MDIPSKNNNRPSVPVNVYPKKVSKKSFNSPTVKDQISTNVKDVGIPKRKDASIPKKIDVDIPQNKVVDIPPMNNNQPSVPINVPPKKYPINSLLVKQ